MPLQTAAKTMERYTRWNIMRILPWKKKQVRKNEKLDRAMARLTPDQKEILVLSRFQGLKYEEISSIRDLSVPAIKVQVHRAIKKLRQHYFKLT
jgi:RNA polymerase sigma-70 factor (ECF subfamily)